MTAACTGSFPEIGELFPSRPPPVKQGPESFLANVASSSKQPMLPVGPAASGSGFFTPAPNNQNGFLGWRPDPVPNQPFRTGFVPGGRDSMSVVAYIELSALSNSEISAEQTIRSFQRIQY